MTQTIAVTAVLRSQRPGTPGMPGTQNQRVAHQVHGHQDAHDEELRCARESRGINQRAQVVRDESFTVSSLSGELVEMVLERRQRALGLAADSRMSK